MYSSYLVSCLFNCVFDFTTTSEKLPCPFPVLLSAVKPIKEHLPRMSVLIENPTYQTNTLPILTTRRLSQTYLMQKLQGHQQ